MPVADGQGAVIRTLALRLVDGAPGQSRSADARPLREGRRARLVLVASVGLLAAAPVAAEPAEAAAERKSLRDEINAVVFGGFDAGSANFVSAGAKVGFGSLDRDGPILMGGAGYGARFERNGKSPALSAGARPGLVLRHTVLAHALGGYQWTYGWGVVSLLVGPELSYEHLASRYAGREPGPRIGGRVHGEVWARPTENTLLNGTLIAGSARGDLWGRIAWGYRVFGVYVGPEAALYADLTGYRKESFGLHATGLELWGATFRVSAGFLQELPAKRDGGYVALALWRAL